MNKTEIVNIKVDAATKKQAQKVAEELGFGLSTLLNAFLKQIVRDQTIRFQIPENKKRIGNKHNLKKLI